MMGRSMKAASKQGGSTVRDASTMLTDQSSKAGLDMDNSMKGESPTAMARNTKEDLKHSSSMAVGLTILNSQPKQAFSEKESSCMDL